MARIKFKRGEFQEFRATIDVHLGKYETYIPKDEIVEFDGSTLKWGGEEYHGMANVRGAVKNRWMVPAEDETSKYRPKPAGVTVRPADDASSKERTEATEITTVDDEERLVGTVAGVRAEAKKQRRVMEVVPAEEQEGEAVHTFSNPAQKKTITVTEGIRFED